MANGGPSKRSSPVAEPGRPLRFGGPVMLAIFLLSGASGLIYQVVWSRALTLVFGSTSQGVATVLAAFMGGLALGSWLASRRGDRASFPLKFYGLLEGGIAILSLCVLVLLPVLDAVYKAIYPVAHLSLTGLTLVRFLLAAIFLLPTTTLMGATLPVLSAYFERRGGVEGQGASILYAVNTAGAVAGTAAAGFWLLPGLGMRGTALLAAGLNLLAALSALALSRLSEEREGVFIRIPFADRPSARPPGAEPAAEAGLGASGRMGVAAAICASGAGALVLEVAWTRTLSLIFGSSTHAFTLMLTTFLIGLAAGSALASRLLGRVRAPLHAFALVELGAGLTAYAGVFLLPELPYLFLQLFRATQENSAWFGAGRFLLAGAVMLPPTLLLGATFPLAVRALRIGTEDAARTVGRLYAVNTLGAIAGSLAAGFLLVPVVGLKQSIVAGGIVNLAAGAFLLSISPTRKVALRAALAGLLVLFMPGLVMSAPPWNPLVMSSGVFQYAPRYIDVFPTRKAFFDYHDSHVELFYKDGRTATVSVEKRPMLQDGSVRIALAVNGKVDASSYGDMDTQVLLGQLPLLLAPRPEKVALIGWGSGITAGSVLTHDSVRSLTAIEIEPAVVEGSRFFREFNHDPYEDPRLDIRINDARHALLVGEETFDLIISEPSNPWLPGPSRLFTREAFEMIRDRLAPGGILCQWVQLYGLETDSYKTLLRTLGSVFKEVMIAKGSPGDTIVLASDSPIRLDVAEIARRMRRPEVAEDLKRIDTTTPVQLLSRFLAGSGILAAVVGDGPLNTDDNALIEFAAARSIHLLDDHRNEVMLALIPWSLLDVADLSGLDGEDRAYFPLDLAREYVLAKLPQRATACLDRVGKHEDLPPALLAATHAIRAEILLQAGDDEGAHAVWEQEALRRDPDCLPALLGLGKHLLAREKDAAAAEKLLSRAVKVSHGAAEPSLELGRALHALGRHAEAVAVLSAAIAQGAEEKFAPFLHGQWGRSCFSLGDADCAIRELNLYFHGWRTVPKPAERSVDAAIDLARAYLAKGDTSDALEQFRVASELGVNLGAWHLEQSRPLLEAGKIEEAIAHLEQAIRWAPSDSRAYHVLGSMYMRDGKWNEGLALWEKLLVRQPEDKLALRGISQSLARLGRLREAAPFLQHLIEVEEDPEEIARLSAAREEALASR